MSTFGSDDEPGGGTPAFGGGPGRAAEELRGQADAEATGIYAGAYTRDAEFYAFTRSLEAYEKTVDPSTTLILDTDSEFLRFLQGPR